MQVPFIGRKRQPAAARRNVAHITGEDKREQQRYKKDRKKDDRQLFPLGPVVTNVGTCTCLFPTVKYCSSTSCLVVS